MAAKSSFYQDSTLVETTSSSLSETATDLSNTDDNSKTSFYSQNDELQEVTAISLLSLLARFHVFVAGTLNAGELLARFVLIDNLTISPSGGSTATALVAPTANAVFSIKKNGIEVITITFLAGATIGTYSGGTVTLTNGDILDVYAPASADATLSTVAITVAATRDT